MPLGEIADVAVREAPEMIRNDNGSLAGYIYVYLDRVTAPEYVDRAQEYLRGKLTLPPGYSMEWTGLYQYAAGGALHAALSSCRSRWRSCSSCW